MPDSVERRAAVLERAAARRVLGLAALLPSCGLGGLARRVLRGRLPPPSRLPQAQGRLESTATLRPEGTRLVVGGRPCPGGPTATAARFDPQTGLWHAASLLPDGSAAVSGGVADASWFRARRGITTVARYLPGESRWTTLAANSGGLGLRPSAGSLAGVCTLTGAALSQRRVAPGGWPRPDRWRVCGACAGVRA